MTCVAGPAPGLELVVGLDAGGTKLAVRAETLGGDLVADITFGAGEWSAVPAAPAASWLLDHVARAIPAGSRLAALGVGAQGCDAPEVAAALEQALAARGVRAAVVNDGALLVPAAGLDQGIGVVVGTGSIAVGSDPAGRVLLAGGWGWVIGDEGGAAAVVREAVRAALSHHDAGQPDDGLLSALTRTFEVPTAERLARAVNDDPTVENWAPHAPAVFAAVEAGSVLADGVVSAAAGQLAALVGKLLARGAVGTTVVAAGSVIVRQPRLAEAFRAELARHHPGLELCVLAAAPVTGAVTLARRLLITR